MKDKIIKLKKEKDFAILAHYYVDAAVQEIADFVGDSYYLSKKGKEIDSKNIILCGVSFMAESVKILNPEKNVYMADITADCPMAHMIDKDKIEEMRRLYDDLAVCCYVNSTAEIKALSDVCVTSSNAVKVVSRLKEKRIFFVPDYNLGRYVAGKLPEKEFILNDGFCHVHKSIHIAELLKAKQAHPKALVLTHPECSEEIIKESDFVGSTSQIIDCATKSDNREFIICTEMGVFYELGLKNPNKKFYSVGHRQFCPNMKKITLEKVLNVLENGGEEINVDEDIKAKADKALSKMLELTEN